MRPALSRQSDGHTPCAFLARSSVTSPRWVHVPPGRQGSSDSPADLRFPSEGLLRMLGSRPLSHLLLLLQLFLFPTSVLIWAPLRPRQAHIMKILGQWALPRAESTQLTCRPLPRALRCRCQLHLSSDPTPLPSLGICSPGLLQGLLATEGDALLTRCW